MMFMQPCRVVFMFLVKHIDLCVDCHISLYTVICTYLVRFSVKSTNGTLFTCTSFTS